MKEEKELTTKEVQDLIWKRRCEIFERTKGKTLKQLIDEANKPKKLVKPMKEEQRTFKKFPKPRKW